MANEGTTKGADPAPLGPPPLIQAEILVYSASECVAKYSITHGDYTIGRDTTCQVQLDVEGVSRHHARLAFQGYELILEDLGSANGVFIEGVQISLPTRVRPDQQVEIGSARLFIRLKAEASEMLEAALWDPDLGLAPVRALLEGKKYKVQGMIGGGGMGVVHQARDLRIRRNVALKVMKSTSQFSRENVLRFVDEAQLTGQLQHPNIVPVYELALDDHGEVFYTMKFVKGITLDQILRGIRKEDAEIIEKYPLTALLATFQKICDAVAYAHSMGVVHRDLKPDNVMIGEYGEVLVMDWGLAKKIAHGAEDAAGDAEQEAPPPDLRGFQTLNGLIVGTPPYIAPEAARGELDQIDRRSDIFVLGAILYAILTLRPPFPGKEFAELIEQIVSGNFPHPSTYNQPVKSSKPPAPPAPGMDGHQYVLSHLPGRRVPEGLGAVVLKAMSYSAADRYQTVAELQADVIAWQGGFAPKAERAGLKRQMYLWAARHKGNVAAFGAIGILLNAALIWFFFSLKHERDLARESKTQLEEAMRDLRGAAPLFADEAVQLAARKEYDRALDRVESALRQVPNDANYQNIRGNILQVMLRWDDAIDSYELALERNPKLTSAKANLELTKKLVESQGEDLEPDAKQIKELQDALVLQDRRTDANALGEKLGTGRPIAGRGLRQAIENDPQMAPLRDMLTRREFRGRFSPLPDGSYSANFRGLPYFVLDPFFQASPPQVSRVVLDEVRFPSLEVVQNMNLQSLSVAGCPSFRSLEPLRLMFRLERLNLSRTKVTDLEPLTDLTLKELNLEECNQLKDFRPLLRCEELESVVLPKHARDIAYLKEHKRLKSLSYRNPNQPVVEFWREFDAKK